MNNRRSRCTPGAWSWSIFVAFFAAAAAGQTVVGTRDGLTLGLSPTGQVQSVALSGVEYASAGIPSGFAWREVLPTPLDFAPNGSFEGGGTAPDSWSWTNDAAGSWRWETDTVAEGARAMRVDVPGAIARRSPLLTSTAFALAPNTFYTISCAMRTLGLSYPLVLFLVEQNSDGSTTQFALSGATGTTDWTTEMLQLTTGPLAVSGFLRAEIFNGFGTAWLDDVRIYDLFAGAAPAPFSGTVTSGATSVTQHAEVQGLVLDATFTGQTDAIRVDVTLSDSTGRDRAIELSFGLPLALTGWSWERNPIASVPIVDGGRYDNLDTSFHGQAHSRYPLATVRDATAAFSLATPMVPQMNRFTYDGSTGFRLTWDLGLSADASKTASVATVSFWIYTQSPAWGFRSAVAKYYLLNPNAFTSVVADRGAWAIPAGGNKLATVPNFRDFGWRFVEGASELAFTNGNGLRTFEGIQASGWFRGFPGYTAQPPYDILVSALERDAASKNQTTDSGIPLDEMAQAVINSSPFDADGRYQLFANSYFWYGGKYQVYPVIGDPDLPAPSMWSIATAYGVDGSVEDAAAGGHFLDGFFLDDMSSVFTTVENHRRAHWASSDFPLTFSYGSRTPVLFDGFSTAEFCVAMRNYVHERGLALMGNIDPSSYVWLAPYFDVLGGEAQGPESLDSAYLRRVLGNGKPWSNLYVPAAGAGAPTGEQTLAYLRQALFLGYFPGLNGTYWAAPAAYERDRSLFRHYVPLIRLVAERNWMPVTAATSSNPSVLVERFDDGRGDVFYLTALNTGNASASFAVTIDPSATGIGSGVVKVRDLVRNRTLSPAASASSIVFGDSLGPGETALYEVNGPRSASPGRGQTRFVSRP